ncbi:hypothetical protein NECAME_08764 [Necator americanus]|uniref:Uncharacterized protein n=1 Tax=Necator americanus TaxID=51031 RepID=W2TJ60_NECAM|nr:hypothetical protein NECAME_08764 [Necator americanus]ETN81062.1 hypothetical protein NECAME_08764 [Necator americanus]
MAEERLAAEKSNATPSRLDRCRRENSRVVHPRRPHSANPDFPPGGLLEIGDVSLEREVWFYIQYIYVWYAIQRSAQTSSPPDVDQQNVR